MLCSGTRPHDHALAIENPEPYRRMSVAREPIASTTPGNSTWADSVLSPSSNRLGNESSQTLEGQFEHELGDLGPSRSAASLFQPLNADLEHEHLSKKASLATIGSKRSTR